MATFIGVAFASAAGWLISLTCPHSAARRHLILATALAGCVLLPVAMAVRSGTNWTLLAIRSSVAGSATVEGAAASPSREHARQPNLAPREEIGEDSAPSPHAAVVPEQESKTELFAAEQTSGDRSVKPNRWASAVELGAAAYVVVTGALLLRLLVSLAALRRIKQRATTVEALVDGTAVMEGDVAVPLAVGFGRPAIVLPRAFRTSASPNELRDVLAHEAEHLKRKDHWVMLLQGVAAAVYWPVVTVHLLNRALVRAREELCDNAVAATREPAAYARMLLAVAERVNVRRQFLVCLAPSVIRRGELERRVAALLDSRRDRRTHVGRRVRWTVVASLLAASTIAGTTRLVAVADQPPASETGAAAGNVAPAPQGAINWTGIPKIDAENAALHRGVVLGPDDKPLAGASIYAASTIELWEMPRADNVDADDLGPVRAVTDAQGRFQFQAEDLTWVTPSGERQRWETVLVATKEGLPSGWLKTWGADRSFREHWHPHSDRDVAVRMRSPATLAGTLLLEGGVPLAGARVRLTSLMAPVEYDLNVHIPREEQHEVGLFGTIDYAESIDADVLPNLVTEVKTGDDGRFELPNLPEGFIAGIEITHSKAVTTNLRVAIRAIDPIYRKQQFSGGEPTLTLYGSGFKAELQQGEVLRGQVVKPSWMGGQPAPGLLVAQANHNAREGYWGQQFTTDAEGRFEITGLAKYTQGYKLAFVGSFAAPYVSSRHVVFPGEDARIEVYPALQYRLKLTGVDGKPIDRDVYSIQVQETPGIVHNGVKPRFNDAQRVAPGVYEGILPQGPAAVLVERGAKADRPAAVDPKAFFAPGRKDWTPQEQRYAYGDAWHITQTPIQTTEALNVGDNWTIDQLNLAAVVFTNARLEDGLLELTATIHSDAPVEVTLVDEAGDSVKGARVERQLEKYNGEDLPATFSVYGLHPNRAEFLRFTHKERGLIGTVLTTWKNEPLRVVMKPAATLVGRMASAAGQPSSDFGVRLFGPGVMPETVVAGRVYQTTEKPGERNGEFRVTVPPDLELRGEFVRQASDQQTRPSVGVAFDPLVPKPGETVQLGDLVAP